MYLPTTSWIFLQFFQLFYEFLLNVAHKASLKRKTIVCVICIWLNVKNKNHYHPSIHHGYMFGVYVCVHFPNIQCVLFTIHVVLLIVFIFRRIFFIIVKLAIARAINFERNVKKHKVLCGHFKKNEMKTSFQILEKIS